VSTIEQLLELDLVELFFHLAIIVFVVKVAGHFSVKLGQPAVLGKLIAGIIIGPALLNVVEYSSIIAAFSQIGVLMLMFLAGLETDLKELNRNLKPSIAVAVGGIVAPLLGGYFLGLAFGLSSSHSLFLGTLLAATSVSISVQTFRELGQMQHKTSVTILGAAIVDDILVVITLAIMMATLVSTDISVTEIILKKVIYFAVIFFYCWKVVPLISRLLAQLKVTEPVMSTAIIHCFLFAAFSESLGVAGIIGAFAAGIALAQTEFKHEAEKKLEPIAYTIFVPVFFASIGLQIQLTGIMENIWFIIAFSLLAIVTKLFGCAIAAKMTGFSTNHSLIVGAGMVSRGEVALIIASIGLTSGLLSIQYFTATVIIILITTMVTPPLLKFLFGREQVREKA